MPREKKYEGKMTAAEACCGAKVLVCSSMPPAVVLAAATESASMSSVKRTLQSALVEIHRDGQRQFEDLETWRRRLCVEPQAADS